MTTRWAPPAADDQVIDCDVAGSSVGVSMIRIAETSEDRPSEAERVGGGRRGTRARACLRQSGRRARIRISRRNCLLPRSRDQEPSHQCQAACQHHADRSRQPPSHAGDTTRASAILQRNPTYRGAPLLQLEHGDRAGLLVGNEDLRPARVHRQADWRGADVQSLDDLLGGHIDD